MTLRYQSLIAAMTLEEKASLLSGANFWNTTAIERLGIPSIMLTDGPHGLRKQAGKADHLGLSASVPATCFPTAAALASSWDVSLLEQVGCAIGREAAAQQVQVLLGPGLNIVRDPLAGRAFEYFSEDPFITGELAAAMVRGIQSTGVAATPKHFAVNSQEYLRMSIDEVVDERTMRELYLEAFRKVITTSAPAMMMTAYNKVNGTYANEHSQLLDTIVRREWHYRGALVTDWGGNHDPVAGVRVGGALEMPSSHGLATTALVAAVQAGQLSESLLDTRVDTLLDVIMTTSAATKNAAPADMQAHHQLAQTAAECSIVLLKNELIELALPNGDAPTSKTPLLPLAPKTKVAVIGDFAETPRYQGAGSSLVHPTQLTNVRQALEQEAVVDIVGYEPGFIRTGRASLSRRRRATALARRADVALVFVGLDEAKEAEGIDRETMSLPQNQLDLIDAVTAVHQRVVVVIASGGAVEVPFADKVQAIIHGSLSGQAGGTAMARILTGAAMPSGKLTVSWPLQYRDAPTAAYFPGREATAEHREGLYVGYRYYETADVAVRYPFGYGLSYTTFAYSELVVTPDGARVTITNTGAVAGDEIVQLYVRPPKTTQGAYRPRRELKGFARISLTPGESKQVPLPFDDHTFAHYDTSIRQWRIAAGDYTIEVGASVRDIRQNETIFVPETSPEAVAGAVANETASVVTDTALLAPYRSGHVAQVSDESFAALLGRTPPSTHWNRSARLTIDDTIAQLRYGGPWWGRGFVGLLWFIQRFLFFVGKPYLANNLAFVINLPFSKIPGFTGGKVSEAAIRRALRIKAT